MQKVFSDMVRDIFVEYFKPLGWKRQGQNYRRIEADGLGKVINFEKSYWCTKDDVIFYINYGVYIEAGEGIENKNFKEYQCQCRHRAKYLRGEYRLTPETDVDAIRDAVIIAMKEAMDFFDVFDSKSTLVRMLVSGEIQKYSDVPVLHYYTCKLLIEMGYYKEIYEYVKSKRGTAATTFAELEKIIESKIEAERQNNV